MLLTFQLNLDVIALQVDRYVIDLALVFIRRNYPPSAILSSGIKLASALTYIRYRWRLKRASLMRRQNSILRNMQ